MKGEQVVIVNEADASDDDTEMQDVEAVPERVKSLLLSVPAEVLQLVLFHADTGALFTSLLSCKTIFDAAQAKHVVLQHLNRMPGLRLGLRDLDTKSLFDTFRRRAVKGLYGAGVLADITRYAPCDDCTSMKRYALFSGKPTLLATAHEYGQVRIYELTETYVRQKAELRIRLQWDDELQRNYHMEILRMAFSNDRDLAVLCRPKQPKFEPKLFPDNDEGKPPEIPKHKLKLVTFHRCHAKTKGHFYASDQQETRDISFLSHKEPVGLALASKGNACITWRIPGQEELTEVVLYGRDAKLMEAQEYDPHPSRLIYPDPPTRTNDTTPARQIFSPFFSTSDRAINFHLPGSPIHNWYTYSTSPSSSTGTILPNNAYITLNALSLSDDSVSGPSYSFKIGIPFHGHHTGFISVSYSAAPMCRTSYLALGECTDADFHGGNNMFICMTEIDSSPALCSHAVNLDAGRRSSSWTALALLAGWKPGTSSLGTVVAISPSCTRVAAASWDRLLVWSLDPGLLHQGSLETYFPACDWNQRKGLGRLRPVRLQVGGGRGGGGGKAAVGGREDVVYGLTWVSETTLYAVTDRGLVRWDVGPKAEGGREELKLAYDAWKETAVAMGMVMGMEMGG